MLRTPGPTTRVAALIGDPVAHSVSPAMHNAAFESLGLDWVYAAFRVAPGDATAAVAAVRALGLAGLSVTMPHKREVALAVDSLGPVADRLGVANTVYWSQDRPGELVGESTDGPGFLEALRDEGFCVEGRTVVVLGSGGAARAVTDAVSGAGVGEVTVIGRDLTSAASCAGLGGSNAKAVGTDDVAALRRAVLEGDLIVNATSVGMSDLHLVPMDLTAERFRSGQLVMDLIYHPATTQLMRVAQAGGARVLNGLSMLVHQARRQVECWTGMVPPVDVMRAAAEAAIRHRNGESR
ncbi:MAG: shikimate dehydrogenase family protein [Acidimicrobiales bacterium]